MLLKIHRISFSFSKRDFSLSTLSNSRKPPKEEYERNIFQTRAKTFDPFNKRWKLTAKSAEPYNIRGGNIEWTKLPFLHRGVQRPGYFDPKTKRFIFVEEMVPEIVVPDLKNFQLKPYVSYNVAEVKNEPFDAKKLYEATLENQVVEELRSKTNKNLEK